MSPIFHSEITRYHEKHFEDLLQEYGIKYRHGFTYLTPKAVNQESERPIFHGNDASDDGCERRPRISQGLTENKADGINQQKGMSKQKNGIKVFEEGMDI